MRTEWDPADPNSPRVKDLGSWAVEEHDRRAHEGLKFVKAVSAESMIKAAVTYRLVIVAQGPDGEDAKYKAEVFVNDEISYRDLRSFSPVPN
ncbi:hypothetical protein ACP70R_016685 [Stipagrostis hirtigluma subsp. patula]